MVSGGAREWSLGHPAAEERSPVKGIERLDGAKRACLGTSFARPVRMLGIYCSTQERRRSSPTDPTTGSGSPSGDNDGVVKDGGDVDLEFHGSSSWCGADLRDTRSFRSFAG